MQNLKQKLDNRIETFTHRYAEDHRQTIADARESIGNFAIGLLLAMFFAELILISILGDNTELLMEKLINWIKRAIKRVFTSKPIETGNWRYQHEVMKRITK